jgi:hypothetical protein
MSPSFFSTHVLCRSTTALSALASVVVMDWTDRAMSLEMRMSAPTCWRSWAAGCRPAGRGITRRTFLLSPDESRAAAGTSLSPVVEEDARGESDREDEENRDHYFHSIEAHEFAVDVNGLGRSDQGTLGGLSPMRATQSATESLSPPTVEVEEPSEVSVPVRPASPLSTAEAARHKLGKGVEAELDTGPAIDDGAREFALDMGRGVRFKGARGASLLLILLVSAFTRDISG